MRTLYRGPTTMWTAYFFTWQMHLTSVERPQSEQQSSREGCWCKLRVDMDLLKGRRMLPETRLMLQSRKEDCLTSMNLTMRVMEGLMRARWMSSPSFEILTFANEFLNCCNRYRNEPLGADKNSLDWSKAKKVFQSSCAY